MDLSQAFDIHKTFLKRLTPVCERIEPVGEIRRLDVNVEVEGVHHIEYLVIPSATKLRGVFGAGKDQPATLLDQLINDLKADEVIRTARSKAEGPIYKKFAIVEHSQIEDFCLKIHITNAKAWPIQMVIKTGPPSFSRRFLLNEGQGFKDDNGNYRRGLLPKNYQYDSDRGVIKNQQGQVLDFETERQVIELAGFDWIEPDQRYMYI